MADVNTPNGDGSEFVLGGLTFVITHLAPLHRIQLWMRASDSDEWVFVHGRSIPRGLTPARAIELMRLFVLGRISRDEYNRLLPGN